MITDNEYYSIKRISHSSLRHFQTSPLTFKMFLDKELEEEKKSYLEDGKIIHMYFLERDKFDETYEFFDYKIPSSEQAKQYIDGLSKFKRLQKDIIIQEYSKQYSIKGKSEDKILADATELKDKYKDYLRYLKAKEGDKEVLNKGWKDKLEGLEIATKNHSIIQPLLYDDPGNFDIESHNEFPILFKEKMWGNECKSLIDRIVIDHKNKVIKLVDLKTTFSFEGLKDKIKEYNYHRQMAFYWMAIFNHFKDTLKLEEYKRETYIIFIKTKDPLEVTIKQIGEPLLNEAILDLTTILKDLSWHMENDKWDHDRLYYEGKCEILV